MNTKMTSTILFFDPSKRIADENKSKLLDTRHGLGAAILSARNALASNGIAMDLREPHIELLRKSESSQGKLLTEPLLRERAYELQDSPVTLRLEIMCGKALVIQTGPVSGYGDTHATVAYFPSGITNEDLERFEEIIFGGLTKYSLYTN